MTTDAFYQPELGCRIVITDPDIPEIVPVIVCQPEPAPAEMSEHYTYRITWSDEDGEYVGLCSEFPSLSWLASTPAAARSGIQYLVSEAVADLRAAAPGIRPPHSIAIPDCPNPCAKPGAPDCQCAANAFPLPVEQSQPPAAEPAAVEPPGDCPYLATPDNCEWPACNLDGVGCRYTEAAAELRRRLNDSIFAPPASPPDVQPQPEQQNQQQAAPPVPDHRIVTCMAAWQTSGGRFAHCDGSPCRYCGREYQPEPLPIRRATNIRYDDDLTDDKSWREEGYYRRGMEGYVPM